MIRIEFQKSGEREFGFSGVVSKHTAQIFLFLWVIEIDWSYFPKDWMLPAVEIIGGKSYKAFAKNNKYANEEPKMFDFDIRRLIFWAFCLFWIAVVLLGIAGIVAGFLWDFGLLKGW